MHEIKRGWDDQKWREKNTTKFTPKKNFGIGSPRGVSPIQLSPNP